MRANAEGHDQPTFPKTASRITASIEAKYCVAQHHRHPELSQLQQHVDERLRRAKLNFIEKNREVDAC